MKQNFKICFIVNGLHAKKCDKLNFYFNEIKNFFAVEKYVSQRKNHLFELAKDLVNKKTCNLIVAAGGDGTLFEIINAIAFSNIPFFPLKCGSSNDFVKSLENKLNFDENKFLNYLQNFKTQKIDIGKIDFLNENKSFFFLNIADVGLGAKTVETTTNRKKLFSTKITYVFNSVKTMINFKYPSIQLKALTDKGSFYQRGFFTNIVAANGSFFGNGLNISPLSEVDDGFLDLVIVKKVSLLKFVLNIPNLRRGKLLTNLGVDYLKLIELELYPIGNQKIPIEADGEFLGYLPVKISVKHNAVSLLK